jgi:hypothetical protein
MSITPDKAYKLADELRHISNQLYDYPYLNFAIQLEGVHMRLVEEIFRQEDRVKPPAGVS